MSSQWDNSTEVTTLHVGERLSLDEAKSAITSLRCLELGPTRRLVVDLRDCAEMSTVGLGLLSFLAQRFASSTTKPLIRIGAGQPLDLLRATRLTEAFDIRLG